MVSSDFNLTLGLVIWASVAAIVIVNRQSSRLGAVGLVAGYLMYMALEHWLPVALYLIPSFVSIFDTRLGVLGFEQSLYGIIAFAVGAVLVGPTLRRHLVKSGPADGMTNVTTLNLHLPRLYLLLGLASFFVIIPVVGSQPTLTSILTNLSKLITVGLVLYLWQARQSRNRALFGLSLLFVLSWPLITSALQGFLGTGIDITLMVLLFVVQAFRLRRRWFVVGVLGGYMLLSLLVTYGQERNTIRAVAWSGDSSLEQRFSTVYSAFTDWHWFDPTKTADLFIIDARQSQNVYIGSFIQRVSNGRSDYAYGSTLGDAFLALIPRIIWPDKPIQSGGSGLVTKYTGIIIFGSTSVGLGQVLEFYINFGTFGVVIGYIILGSLLAILDEVASVNLRKGDWERFALWYVPGLGLLQVGNTLLNLTVVAGSGLVTMVLVNKFVVPLFSPRPEKEAEQMDRSVSYGRAADSN